MLATIQPSATFNENLALLPPIDGLVSLDLVDEAGTVIASIPNQAGKQGSLAVYNYLHITFGALDPAAARHGLVVFAEHTADARKRPGAHPNIDRLLAIAAGGAKLAIRPVRT